MGRVTVARQTRETQIELTLSAPEEGVPRREDVVISTGVPFFDHMLNALFFHGGIAVSLRAEGDIEVDEHHTVEDVGIVVGEALRKLVAEHGPIARFGHEVVPMDDALAEVTIDAAGRAYLVYSASYPQSRCGSFDMSLVREFFQGLATSGRMNVHIDGRYAQNSHHLSEAIFKATGRALRQAYRPAGGVASTKGVL